MRLFFMSENVDPRPLGTQALYHIRSTFVAIFSNKTFLTKAFKSVSLIVRQTDTSILTR